jgi:hypothetical protein
MAPIFRRRRKWSSNTLTALGGVVALLELPLYVLVISLSRAPRWRKLTTTALLSIHAVAFVSSVALIRNFPEIPLR